jgi:hypothetical protein
LEAAEKDVVDVSTKRSHDERTASLNANQVRRSKNHCNPREHTVMMMMVMLMLMLVMFTLCQKTIQLLVECMFACVRERTWIPVGCPTSLGGRMYTY